ncbi:MAG: TolC family protein [Burkholderiaceae bacterium]|nr:TolC family protein [Burkholderiaceae bacterium]
MFPFHRAARPWPALAKAAGIASLAVLAGCASSSPEALRTDVTALVGERTGLPSSSVQIALPPAGDDAAARATAAGLPGPAPLTADAAVRIALLHSPRLQSSMAALGVSDAERAQAGRLPNPHLSLGRFTEGGTREIERMLSFDVLGLVTLPWRVRWQGQQVELAKLAAAQDVVALAADTRRAWVRAVASAQVAAQAADALDAAEAGTELARRMQKAGNFNRLQLAREEALLAEARIALARAQQAALREREQLVRLMGIEGSAAQSFALPAHLAPVPQAMTNDVSPGTSPIAALPADASAAEAQAIAQRLDVRAAQLESRFVAESLGYTRATGFVDAVEVGYGRNTSWEANGDRSVKRGWELGLPIPLFDWGQARNARARGLYLQSAARVRDVAVRARSEAREALAARDATHSIARQAHMQGVAVQQVIQDETLLRYNGMLASVWDVLAEARATTRAVTRAIEAQRDFWLADTDLRQALSGSSPGGLALLSPSTSSATDAAAPGH